MQRKNCVLKATKIIKYAGILQVLVWTSRHLPGQGNWGKGSTKLNFSVYFPAIPLVQYKESVVTCQPSKDLKKSQLGSWSKRELDECIRELDKG